MSHPHDVALLYDLVDGRLGERAAAELRQRIADEPGLRATWDEIVVTYFTAGAQNTLPLLLFGFIRQGQNLPIVNAIALVVIVVSVIPVALAQRLTSDTGVGRG